MKNSIKKVLALVVMLIMTITMCFTTSAGTVTTNGGTDTGTAYATYVASPDVYSVAITWGAMTYTYTQTWNTGTRTNTYAWAPTVAGTSNKITIANSSNVGVKATLAWTPNGTITGVTGTFGSSTLTTLAPTEGGAATTSNTTLTLGGTPSTHTLSSSTVGTITLTISKNP